MRCKPHLKLITQSLGSTDVLKYKKETKLFVNSFSPAELSSDQQSSSAPSAVPHIAGADLMASQSGSGRPQSLLPVVCSAAQVIEPVGT